MTTQKKIIENHKSGVLESAMIIQQIWRNDNHNPDWEKRAETVGVLQEYASQFKQQSPVSGITDEEVELIDIKLPSNHFKKVIMEGSDSLPLESGEYECVFNDNSFGTAKYDISGDNAAQSDIWWINRIKWYYVIVDEIHYER